MTGRVLRFRRRRGGLLAADGERHPPQSLNLLRGACGVNGGDVRNVQFVLRFRA